MHVLVIGRNGQLARALGECVAGREDVHMSFLGRPEIDLVRPEGLEKKIIRTRPDIVINAAAYTSVDLAESEPELAHAVNADAPELIARAMADIVAPVIHVSTDYVFDGSGTKARTEADPVGPKGVYGRTKLAGERAVTRVNPRHIIVRTAWLYSIWGNNFLTTMMRLAEERDSVGVVDDQLGNPTSAEDLANALLSVAAAALQPDFSGWGIYHVAGRGTASWREFAETVFDERQRLGLERPVLGRLTTDQYPTAAERPANSRLCQDKLQDVFDVSMPWWQDSVRKTVRRLVGVKAD